MFLKKRKLLMNMILLKNGKIKYVSKLPNNVIDNLYLIKRK